MTRTPAALVLALLPALPLAGCGTVFNVQAPGDDHQFSPTPEESRRVYGGVRFDAENLMECLETPVHASLLFGPLLLLDLPLSAAADTLTLPLTVPAALRKLLSPPGAGEPAVPPAS